MSRRKWYAVGAVAVVAALGLALGLGGGQEQSAPLAQGGLPPAGGLNEGVQVHGHWTLEVRDPDGSLVSHQEFENALGVQGQQALAEVLTKNTTAGDWDIWLSCDPISGSPFRNGSGGPDYGLINEPCSYNLGPNYFYNLNKSFNESLVIILTGSAQAQAAGNITVVNTVMWSCTNDHSPIECNCSHIRSSPYIFTAATLPEPVQLAANQWVTAEVDISFQ